MTTTPYRICFVCTGNICRSPTAEVVLRAKLDDAGLGHLVEVDSAGTGGWHVGDDMDSRSRRALLHYGYEPDRHSAKQFTARMFASRDLVVALDDGHLATLTRLARTPDAPEDASLSIVALRSFDEAAAASGDLEVPDPYYGRTRDFHDVVEMVELACDGLVERLRAQLPQTPLLPAEEREDSPGNGFGDPLTSAG